MDKYEINLNYRGSKVASCHFWHWRRIVSLVILIAFSSSILSPAFASYEAIDGKVNGANGSGISNNQIKFKNSSNKDKTGTEQSGLTNYRLQPSLMSDQENNNSKYFTPKPNFSQNRLFSSKNKYQPYFELGGAKYFNQNENVAGIYDLFIPLWQSDDKLFFADLRIFDRSGSSSEGNLHLGFRKFYPVTKQMIGIYASFDRKRTDHKNWFSQIMVGAEYWHDRWFIGGNFYKPIGKTLGFVKELPIDKKFSHVEPSGRSIAILATTKYYEKPQTGFDAELGFSFTENLTGYAGGYYFHEKDTDTTAGPKLRLTYNYREPHGRILGVLDGIGIEVGAQHDKPRGTTAYIGIKFKVGLTNLDKNSNLFGFERHMTELVRRDPDIIVEKSNTPKTESRYEYYQHGDEGFYGGDGSSGSSGQKNSKSRRIRSYSEWDLEELWEEFGLSKDLLKELSKKEVLRIIKKKYNKHALKYHPDRSGAKEGTPLYKQNKEFFIKYTDIREVLEGKIKKSDFKRRSTTTFSKPENRHNTYQSNDHDKQDQYNQNLAVELYQRSNLPNVDAHVNNQSKSEQQSLVTEKTASKALQKQRVKQQLPLVLKPLPILDVDAFQKNKMFRGRDIEIGTGTEKQTEERRAISVGSTFDMRVEMVEPQIKSQLSELSRSGEPNELSISNSSVFVGNGLVGDLWESAICKETDFISDTDIRNGNNATETYLERPVVLPLGAGLGSNIAWLGTKISEGVALAYTYPKTTLAGIATTLSGSWIVTKYFLGSLFNRGTKVRRSKGKRKRRRGEPYFGGGDDDGEDGFPPDGGFPFGRGKYDDWRDIFSILPLFFTMSSGGMTIPVFIPRNSMDEELSRLTLGSLGSTPSLSHDPKIVEVDTLPTKNPTRNEGLGSSVSTDVGSERRHLADSLDRLRREHGDLGTPVPMLTFPDWNYHPQRSRDSKKLRRKAESEKRVRKRGEEERDTVEGADADTIEEDGRLPESEEVATIEDAVNLDYEYEDNDVEALLVLRAQEAGLDVVRGTTVILPPLDYRGGQLREQLEDERRRHRREGRRFARIILVPLHVLHLGSLDHWAGLVIRLNRDGQVTYIEYVDSLGNRIPSNVEATLRIVYGRNIVIRNVQGSWQADSTGCGPLMVENLIQASQNRLRSHVVEDREMRAIRGHHVGLLERYRPELQFNFRQGRNVRSFEYETSEGLKLNGGFFTGFPVFSFPPLGKRNLLSIPNLRIAVHGGSTQGDDVSSDGSSSGEGVVFLPSYHQESVIPICEVIKQVIKRGISFGLDQGLSIGASFLSAIMISKLGVDELAASGLVASMSMIIFVFSTLLNGTTYLVEKKYKASNYSDVGLILQQSWLTGVFVALPSILTAIFSKDILVHMLKQDPKTSTLAQDYFRSYVWGILPSYMLDSNIQTAIGIDRADIMLGTTFVQKGLTLSLMYIYLFKLKLGMVGVGLAESISNWVFFIGTTGWLMAIDWQFGWKYGFFKICEGIKIKSKNFCRFLRFGFMEFGRFVVELISIQVSSIMIGWLGDNALAGTGIVNQFTEVILVPTLAVVRAGYIFGGGFVEQGKEREERGQHNLAKEKYRNAVRFVNTGIFMSMLFPLTGLVFFVTIPNQLISIFVDIDNSDNMELLSTTRNILFVTLGGLLNNMYIALRGTPNIFLDTNFDAIFPTCINLLGLVVIYLPLAYLFAFPINLGVVGIVLAQDIGLFFSSMAYLIRWVTKSCKATRLDDVEIQDQGCWASFRNFCSRAWHSRNSSCLAVIGRLFCHG